MNKSYAILIDGGFVKYKLGTSKNPMTSSSIHEFIDKVRYHPALVGTDLHRVYYYDAMPYAETEIRPLDNKSIEFGKSESFTKNRKLFAELVRLPKMAMRTGETAFNGWQIKKRTLSAAQEGSLTITGDDLGPLITQKGVDMRIGLDIASLTLKKHVQIIVLVTGDSDFVPAMKFARKEGAQLFLVPLGHGIKDTMHEHADLILEV